MDLVSEINVYIYIYITNLQSCQTKRLQNVHNMKECVCLARKKILSRVSLCHHMMLWLTPCSSCDANLCRRYESIICYDIYVIISICTLQKHATSSTAQVCLPKAWIVPNVTQNIDQRMCTCVEHQRSPKFVQEGFQSN